MYNTRPLWKHLYLKIFIWREKYSLCFIVLLLLFSINVMAANEFYVTPGGVVMVNGEANGQPTLFVNGNITNVDGNFTNDSGVIELTGDWTHLPMNNRYSSTGIERFSGIGDQHIYGTWNGINFDAFHQFKVKKNQISGQNVLLHGDVNVKDSIVFEGSTGIIRTQPSSYLIYPGSGDYAHTLYLLNGAVDAIRNHSKGNGANTRYIEGKLKRKINEISADYYFPVGVAPTILDGMEAVSLRFNLLPAENAITTYASVGGQRLYNNVVFCDIGTDPTPSYDPFLNCTAGAGQDGYIDIAYLNTASVLEWYITPDLPGVFDYNVEVFPGPKLDATVPAMDISICGGPYSRVRYLAKDGIQGGDNAGAEQSGSPIWPYINGYYVCPTGNILEHQRSFSVFRLHGTENGMTELPVEILDVSAKPMNNSYIDINWQTATEQNLSHYITERSTDGHTFQAIAQTRGPLGGNSSNKQYYIVSDKSVLANQTYYYRIKSVDFDGTFTYSRIVNAQLKSTRQGIYIGNVFPNPSPHGQSGFYVNTDFPINIKIKLLNILGQEIDSNEYALPEGQSYISLNSQQWPTGNYVLQIIAGEYVSAQKITIGTNK